MGRDQQVAAEDVPKGNNRFSFVDNDAGHKAASRQSPVLLPASALRHPRDGSPGAAPARSRSPLKRRGKRSEKKTNADVDDEKKRTPRKKSASPLRLRPRPPSTPRDPRVPDDAAD